MRGSTSTSRAPRILKLDEVWCKTCRRPIDPEAVVHRDGEVIGPCPRCGGRLRVRTKRLRGGQFELLEYLDFLSGLQASRSGSGARYAVPGQAYLAERLGVSIRTVGRWVARCAEFGVLAVTHRRKVRGRWRTNLYRIVTRAWWKTARAIRLIWQASHRRTQKADIAQEREKTNKRDPPGEPSPTPDHVSQAMIRELAERFAG